jgi:Electron transfer DM13
LKNFTYLKELKIMKLNQLLLLGTTSLLISTLPIASYAAKNFNNWELGNSQTLVAQSSSVAMSGSFVAGEKPTTGTAQIISEGGHNFLELDEAFSTSDQGPDLHVLLDPAETPPKTYEDMNSPVNLGKLHSYTGTQRYPIPDVINPSQFKSVVIWCRMANATFGYAPLQ